MKDLRQTRVRKVNGFQISPPACSRSRMTRQNLNLILLFLNRAHRALPLSDLVLSPTGPALPALCYPKKCYAFADTVRLECADHEYSPSQPNAVSAGGTAAIRNLSVLSVVRRHPCPSVYSDAIGNWVTLAPLHRSWRAASSHGAPSRVGRNRGYGPRRSVSRRFGGMPVPVMSPGHASPLTYL